MALFAWRSTRSVSASSNGSGPGASEPVPGIPVHAETADSFTSGAWLFRDGYARRDEVPADNTTTRCLAGAMHQRVHRINQGRNWLGRWRDRALGRPLRPIGELSDLAGDYLAEWALKNVLYAHKRPVPSFGFGLAPVLTHVVAARRQRRVRQILLTCAVTLVAVRHPWGALALCVGVLLYQLLFATGRARRLLGWGAGSLVSMALLAAGVFVVWTQVRPWTPLIRQAGIDAIPAAVGVLAAVTAVYWLDRWVAFAYLDSLAPRRENIARRPRLAPMAAKRIAECETTEMWQSIAYQQDEGYDRFVGAGRAIFRGNATRIQLTPARTAADEDAPRGGDSVEGAEDTATDSLDDLGPDGFKTFEADELLDRVRDELEALRGKLVETHALPSCDVAEVLAVPRSRWKKLPRTAETKDAPSGKQEPNWPEAREMVTQGRLTPSGHWSRRYLSAQVVSWKGDLVVTVFAHAALEGKTLHFVTRPHILAPPRDEATAVPAKGWNLLWQILAAPLHAIGDTIALAHQAYGVVGRSLGLLNTTVLTQAAKRHLALAMELEKSDKNPVSLREHCAQTEPEDMHQAEDAYRHISILQSRMFSTVSAFLADHGLAVGEFKRQAAEINQWFINGDNTQINTGNIGGNQTQQTQQPDGAQTKG